MKQEYEYSYILEATFNRIKNLEKGVLFECIEILEPIHANKIREQFNITDSDSYRDDFRVMKGIPFFDPILNLISPIIISVPIISNTISFIGNRLPMHSSSSASDHTNSMKAETHVSNMESSNSLISQTKHFLGHISPPIAIVVIALAVIGLYFVGRNKKTFSEKGNSITPKSSGDGSLFSEMRDKQVSSLGKEATISQQALEYSADLCLVVPCNCIPLDLRDQMDREKELSADDTITLVENSAYFLVTKSCKEPMFQLDNNFKDFPEDEYLFIRLRISNRRDLMKIDLPGSLSRAISSQEPMVIQEIGLRQDFSNLEKFHRA